MQFPWSFWTVSQTPNLSGPGGYQNQGYQGGKGINETPVSLNNIVAYYKFDNGSNFGLDSSPNGYNLTTNGSPSSVAGIINNGISLTSVSNYLSYASNATPFQMSDTSFTITCWFYTTTYNTATTRRLISMPNSMNYFLELNYNLGSSFVTFGFNNGGGLGLSYSLNTWNFIVAWIDIVANTTNIQINNGAPSSQTLGSNTVNTTADSFAIGDPLLADNEILDEIGIWKRVLTSTERSNLWNNGIGLQYPF